MDVGGKRFIALRSAIEEMGGKVAWDNHKKEATVDLNGKTTVITMADADMTFDGQTITLSAAPTSTARRIAEACARSTGFVYAVSRTGVTGTENAVPAEVDGLVARIRDNTALPVCVGFGISKPDHVKMVCQVADGAVVGSFVVNLLKEEWPHGRSRIVEAIRELKDATL